MHPTTDFRGERHDRCGQEACMRLLLTSGGVTNTSIRDALVDLLGKPIAGSSALCIPTAEWGHPSCAPASAWRFIAGQSPSPMCGLGWKSVDFSIFPHLAQEGMPGNTMAEADRWAAPTGLSRLRLARFAPNRPRCRPA